MLSLVSKSLCIVLFVVGIMKDSSSAQAKPARSFLLVANQGDRTLSIIDIPTGKQVAAVAEEGITGHEVAASPDGRTAYVPIYGDSGVGKPGTDGSVLVVIDIPTRKIIGHVDFGHGVRPHCVIYEQNSGLLLVTTELDQTVTLIDPKTLTIVGAIPTSQAQSHMLVISHDGSRGYTSNVKPGSVSVLDLKGRKLLKVIPISNNSQRISISNDDKLVFTADQTKPQLAVIDTSSNTIKNWIPLPAEGYGSAATKDGRSLLIALPSVSKVAIIDLRSSKVMRTIDVPRSPTEILVSPDGQFAYVSCGSSHQVAVIDVAKWTLRSVIDAGEGADGLAWAAAP